MKKKETYSMGKKPKHVLRERRPLNLSFSEEKSSPGQTSLNVFFFLVLVVFLLYQAASSINRISLPDREVFRGSDCFPPSCFPVAEACPKYRTKFLLNSSMTISVSLANSKYVAPAPFLRKGFVLSKQLHEFQAVLPVKLLAEYDKVAVEVYSHNFEIKHLLRDAEDSSPDYIHEVTTGWAGTRPITRPGREARRRHAPGGQEHGLRAALATETVARRPAPAARDDRAEVFAERVATARGHRQERTQHVERHREHHVQAGRGRRARHAVEVQTHCLFRSPVQSAGPEPELP